MLQMYNALSPGRLRLVTRLSHEGVKIEVPASFAQYQRHSLHCSLLKQIIADNIARRPLYVLWTAELLQEAALTAAVAPYYQVATSNLPGAQLMLRPPGLAVARPHPQHEQRIPFGPPRPKGAPGDALEFLGYDLTSLHTDDLPLLQINYYWRVSDPGIARQARVWVLFTDAAGRYQQGETGSPVFHNIHPLAYGLGARVGSLPAVLRETYTLSVPPSEWNKALHLRIAVEAGGQFLPRRADRSPWAEIGELSFDPAKEGLLRVAAAGSLGGSE